LNAKPILEKFEIPATAFVCAGWTGRTDEMWWDQLGRTILKTNNLPDRLELNVNGQHFEWNVHGSNHTEGLPIGMPATDHFPSRLKFLYEVWEVIRKLPPDFRSTRCRQLTHGRVPAKRVGKSID